MPRVPEARRAFRSRTRNGLSTDEVAGQVRLGEQVLVGRLDAGRGAHDVRDRRRRRDREHVRVAHARARRSSPAAAPSPAGRRAGPRSAAPRSASSRSTRVLRQQAAVPLRARVGRVGAALGREVARRLVGVVRDGLHHLVGEVDARLATRTPCRAGRARTAGPSRRGRPGGGARWPSRRLGRVEVDVDHVVQRADRDPHRLAQLGVVELAVGRQVLVEHDRAEVADRGLVRRRC